jgi:hypothetical protein
VGTSSSGAISNNHRFVVFTSSAANLSPGATSGRTHVFVHDLDSGATDLVSTGIGGSEPNGASSMGSISSDGRYVSFESYATNLVAGDGNRSADVFVHDSRASGAQVVCEPGLAGVRACPCANAPAGPGRGCDNSSATGGASLAASGSAYLSSDSLTFTTSGERATALSTVFEGTTFLPSGTVLGQGVRCIGGNLVRLYTKGASAGSITAPDSRRRRFSRLGSIRGEGTSDPGGSADPLLRRLPGRHGARGLSGEQYVQRDERIRVFWWP